MGWVSQMHLLEQPRSQYNFSFYFYFYLVGLESWILVSIDWTSGQTSYLFCYNDYCNTHHVTLHHGQMLAVGRWRHNCQYSWFLCTEDYFLIQPKTTQHPLAHLCLHSTTLISPSSSQPYHVLHHCFHKDSGLVILATNSTSRSLHEDIAAKKMVLMSSHWDLAYNVLIAISTLI